MKVIKGICTGIDKFNDILGCMFPMQWFIVLTIC